MEKFTEFWESGIYKCSKCGAKLFDSESKFKSGTMWPSFRKPSAKNIETKEDHSFGMVRTEIVCAKCGHHLGHVFDDGKVCGDKHPEAGMRFCVLSESLNFEKDNIIQRGAEAVLCIEKIDGKKVLVKERGEKKYRVAELDKKLRKERTSGEAGLLSKAVRNNLPVPRILDSSDFKIVMEYIEGEKLKDVFNQKSKNEIKNISSEVGSIIAKLHACGIIHGDLTTSNMILRKEKIYLIDFGLGKNSLKIEDQATDLYLLYESIKSTHFKHLDIIWENILEGYKGYQRHKEVIKRLEEISKRRRYKTD